MFIFRFKYKVVEYKWVLIDYVVEGYGSLIFDCN